MQSVASNLRHIAIIGSGPAGFYTAQHILKHISPQLTPKITIFEQQKAPFGLLRYGVAPDHPEVKNPIHKFTTMLKSDQVEYVGGCKIGQDLKLDDLKDHYHAVVITTGSQSSNTLNIPNEDAKNIYTAQEFVGWYNGDPKYASLEPELDENVVVIGNGNVALDICRLLLKNPSDLQETDITSKSLDQLSRSRVKNVTVLGRRGVLEASFGTKELREMFQLGNLRFEHEDMLPIIQSTEKTSLGRVQKRVVSILESEAEKVIAGIKTFKLSFQRQPKSIITENGKVVGLEVLKTERFEEDGKVVFKPSSECEIVKCGLLIKSIGYRNVPLEGAPFDNQRKVIPSDKGRVGVGLYCAGWIKTGSVGVLTSTMYDAIETASSVIEDLNAESATKAGLEGLHKSGRLSQFFSKEDWFKMDELEVQHGLAGGKPREKIIK